MRELVIGTSALLILIFNTFKILKNKIYLTIKILKINNDKINIKILSPWKNMV